MNFPVYYVVAESFVYGGGPLVYRILSVTSCMLTDVGDVYEREVIPLYVLGRPLHTWVFAREPDNPFREAIDDETP